MKKNLYLIGLPGSGKTTLGKTWAEKLGVPFYDLDQMIESEEKCTISEIFSKKGEKYFRKIESEMLRGTTERVPAVIACGGGTPCFYGNMDWMYEQGITVFLDTDLEIIEERLKGDSAIRPLLAGVSGADTAEKLRELREKRMPYYAKAHLTSTLTPPSVILYVAVNQLLNL